METGIVRAFVKKGARLLFDSPYVDGDRRSSPADDLDQGRRTGEQRAPQA